MNNRKLIEQCIVMFALVIIMGFVLFFTYEESDAHSYNSKSGEAAATVGAVADAASENDYEGIIRLHVIANSDSESDQELKLKVRDAIISQVGDLSSAETQSDTREWVASHLDDFTKTANEVIRENGCNYTASADLGVRWIPEKTYDDMYFPAGNYEALNITLGKGEGQNWWCVLFPPLCLITEDEEEMAEMGIDSQDQIKVKSWLREVLGE